MTTQARTDADLALGAIGVGAAVLGVLYAGGVCAAIVSGHPVPHGHPLAGVSALGHAGDPSVAWHAPVGPAPVYWAVTAVLCVGAGLLARLAWRLFHPHAHRADDPAQIDGLANRVEVAAAASGVNLVAQAPTLRPSVERAKPNDVGWRLGTSRGVECWMGVRDSAVILGPPGSGKGLNLVIPAILDAPGAVVTTSTRPDNLTVTMTARGKTGPVGVFDPQGLAPGVPSRLRWSPVRGCERPQTAMLRAMALTAGSAKGVTDANFWEQQTQTAVRCLLHAAAVGGRDARSLAEWSLSASSAREAVTILSTNPSASPAWDRALDGIVSADQRTRDSVWAMVANAFASLADPGVLAAVSPPPGEEFDPVAFVREKGTLYLLGTASGASACAGLISALVEDVVDVARRMAATSPGARLDPPLALVLDEAANYPLPSLGPLMSEGGGSGIPTMVVLQSLAQARDRWGRETAGAIWDSATAKIVLPGSANADDLADISRLLGERSEVEESQSHQLGPGAGSRSVSISTRQRPILDPSAIRTLPPGTGLLLLRSAPPILLQLQPWIARRDASLLKTQRSQLESAIQTAALDEWRME